MNGRFLSIDGIDGCGKSTQIEMLAEWFQLQGTSTVVVRDPGGTKLGEALREILLHRDEIPLEMTAEMLLYMASRAQLMAEIIKPALEEDKVVIADRFLLANVVYQGSGGGLSTDAIWQVGRIATGDRLPDCTFLLDLAPEVSLQRIDRQLDRLERRGGVYMSQVRDGYLTESARMGARVVVIDGNQSPQSVHQQILEEVRSYQE